jgi:transposase-like protein
MSKISCIYCHSSNVIKKGVRRKKHETIQLYFCNHCERKFTPLLTRHKTFPLKVILDSLTYYNRLYTMDEAAKKTTEKYGLKVSPQNISNWLDDFGRYLPFLRLREFVVKKYKRHEALEENRLFHGQIYEFKYHRAKLDCLLSEEYRHYKLAPLQEFLEIAVAECPHSIFKDTRVRASELKGVFDLEGVKIIPKENYAVKNTRLILQTVDNNRLRHETVQNFFVVNDSVTVAAEVPILLDEDDWRHFKVELGFTLPKLPVSSEASADVAESSPGIITGHIDLIQVRNGAIHILDFKPRAKKQKPIDQLTLYALAMSRLTGIRLYYFKCGWFDENNYYEFFPLHVVHKKKRRRRRKK